MSRLALPSTAETTGCFSRQILLWCMSRILGAAPQSLPGKQKNKEKLSLTLRIENAIPTQIKKQPPENNFGRLFAVQQCYLRYPLCSLS